jgi:hypothetical protein
VEAGNALAPLSASVRAQDIAPVVDGLNREETDEIFRATAIHFLELVFCIRRFGAVPILKDKPTLTLWREVYNQSVRAVIGSKSPCQTSEIFVSLDFPDLGILNHEDIVKLRSDSEAFGDWRGRVHSVMNATRARITSGADPKDAFEQESWPLKDAATRIRSELDKSSFRRHLKRTAAQCIFGATALYALSPLLEPFIGADPSFLRNLAKSFPAGAASMFFWLLFDRSAPKGQLELKFYNALLDSSAN